MRKKREEWCNLGLILKKKVAFGDLDYIFSKIDWSLSLIFSFSLPLTVFLREREPCGLM